MEQEPRIFTTKPKWVGLEETKRGRRTVEFKTPTGYLLALRSEVEEWERKNGNRKV